MDNGKRKQSSVLRSSSIGVGVSTLLCIAGLMLLAHAVLQEWIGNQKTIWVVFSVLVISVFFGGLMGRTISGETNNYIPLIVAGMMYTLLLISGALAVEGEFVNHWVFLAACGVGGILSCVMCLKSPRKRRGKKVHPRYFTQNLNRG